MSGSTLKIIAIIAMVIDHFGEFFRPEMIIFRQIGRLAFPIFCFLLVEGFYNTKDFKKYLGRLISFAFISEIPFDLATFGRFPVDSYNNVFFTLAIGLIAIYGIDYFKEKNGLIMGVFPVALCAIFAEVLNTDYAAKGILMIVCFYFIREFDETLIKIIAVLGIIGLNLGVVSRFAILALIPIYFYNKKRGLNLKYIFYLVYPVHLAVFALIKYVQSMGTF